MNEKVDNTASDSEKIGQGRVRADQLEKPKVLATMPIPA